MQEPSQNPAADPAPRAATAARGPLDRRPRLRRLRKRLDPGPRGDRARQGRGLRESRQDPARLRVGIAAGAFAFLALILIMHGIAWLLDEELFDGNIWPGFFVEAARSSC